MFAHALVRLAARRWAPWLLLMVSASAHIVVTELGADPFKQVDLRVYVDGAHHLTDGTLYDFLSGSRRLPFTYPPFSALLFTPLSWLPWNVTRIGWQLGMFASLSAIIYLTLRLLGRTGPGAGRLESLRGIVVTGTALSVWMEPVRTTFNYGQINLFLTVLVLGGAVLVKDWAAGLTVGLAAGIKLIPAITGLYYLVQRRLAAAIWSLVFFGATVALMLVIIPHQTWRYFTRLMLDPSRTGPVYSAINQSWRGTLDRLAGHPVGAPWVLAVALTVPLGLWAAWSATRADDRTAALLAVQFTGLLVSPVSWSHHWVWVLPLLVWGLFGPRRDDRRVRVLVGCWSLAVFSYLVSILVAVQGQVPVNSRPGWQSWLAAVYVLLGVFALIVMVVINRPGSPGTVTPGTPSNGSSALLHPREDGGDGR